MEEQRRRRRRTDRRGKVLAVTGVQSALAVRLLRRLDEDARVSRLILIDREPVKAPLVKAASYRIDFSEPNADGQMAEIIQREGVTAFVHMAFHRAPPPDAVTAHELESVGTMHVIGAVAQAATSAESLRHLLVVSTALVYGADPHGPAVLTESDALRGCMGYPFIEAKVDAEQQLEAARPRLPVPVTVLRPSCVLGPGDDGIMGRYFRSLVMPTVWGYDPLVQLVHPEDVVEACRVALERRPNGAYNIGGTGPLPLGTLLRLAGKVDMPLTACVAPAVIDLLWRLGMCAFPGAHVPYLRYPVVADCQRAVRDFGFRPKRSTLETLEHFMGRRVALAA
jgi:UDP-glucose 4-epimerase